MGVCFFELMMVVIMTTHAELRLMRMRPAWYWSMRRKIYRLPGL